MSFWLGWGLFPEVRNVIQKYQYEGQKIEVVREWPEPNSVWDIQVFLSFANFYRRFMQGFSRIAVLLTSILKTTNKLAPNRNNGSRSSFNRNDHSKPSSRRNDGNCEVNRVGGDSVKHAKKLRKLKYQKSAKSQKSFKSEKSKGEKSKKSPKSKNLPNFNAKNTKPRFFNLRNKVSF